MELNYYYLIVALLYNFSTISNASQFNDLIQPGCGSSSIFPNHREPRPSKFSKLLDLQMRADTQLSNSPGVFRNPKILSGIESKKHSWPWQVSIKLSLGLIGDVGHWCGGVLIHPRWILTAGHCIKNPMFDSLGEATWTVILSEHDRDFLANDEIVLPVLDIIIHPEFVEYQNDIAMLYIPHDNRLSELAPICLPAKQNMIEESFLGVKCLASGWGQHAFGGDLSSQLHHVDLKIVNNSHCQTKYWDKYGILIHDYHICAGPIHTGGKGTCVGDSGGPLHCNMRDGKWYLAGLISFGSGCAKPGFPDVFTRITSYLDFIESNIQQKE